VRIFLCTLCSAITNKNKPTNRSAGLRSLASLYWDILKKNLIGQKKRKFFIYAYDIILKIFVLGYQVS